MSMLQRRISLILAAGFLAALFSAGAAGAVDARAGCLGVDRSAGGGFDSGGAFAAAVVTQHEYDRDAGYPASFGHSIGYDASTGCGTR